jgi:hypothetical protein
MCGAAPAMAQTAPSLGDAEDFAVLGGSTVTVAGTGSVITGHVGVSPGTSITGLPGGATLTGSYTTYSNTAEAIAARVSSDALYADLVGRGGATAIPAELGGTTLTPGTYSIAATANIMAGATLTLDGAGVYIIQVGTTLTAGATSNVVLLNGASSNEVFWQAGTTATLGGTTFSGTVVAQSTASLGVGATLDGRLLATTTVTLGGSNTIDIGDVGGGSGGGLVYSITNFVSGSTVTLSVSGATPGGTVLLGYSLTGAGPSTTVFGVVDMDSPILVLGSLIADVTGYVVHNRAVPVGATGLTVYTQCLDLASGTLSNSLAETAL